MRDNHPTVRRLRKAAYVEQRKKALLAGISAVLIICEGRETEPNYLKGLIHHLEIPPSAVRIVPGDTVTDPVGLVRKAQQLFMVEGGYERVYVVCDGDGRGLDKARVAARKRITSATGTATAVEMIVSSPSIEFWLLLHLEYSARPFSTAQEVHSYLLSRLPDYQKQDRRIFEKMVAGLDRACRWAERLKLELEASGASLPDTDMHRLVASLKGLAARSQP